MVSDAELEFRPRGGDWPSASKRDDVWEDAALGRRAVPATVAEATFELTF